MPSQPLPCQSVFELLLGEEAPRVGGGGAGAEEGVCLLGGELGVVYGGEEAFVRCAGGEGAFLRV